MDSTKLMVRWGEALCLHSYKHLSHPTGKTLAKENKANIEYYSVETCGLNVQFYSSALVLAILQISVRAGQTCQI